MQIDQIQTQRVLSPTNISLADYSINPYRGCAFECLYCYARKNKNSQHDHSKVAVKINAPEILEKELKFCRPKRVLLGSATECFQYAEHSHGITARILKILNSHRIPYTILTKSNLVVDYLNLIEKNKNNQIYFTFNFHEEPLARLFEARSPSVLQRIHALEDIIKRKIDLRVHIGPFIPYLCDLRRIIQLLPQGIKKINVEIYHHSMGNYSQVINKINQYIGQEFKEKIDSIYSNKKNYDEFSQQIRQDLIDLKTLFKGEIFFIAPEYDQFYSKTIDYQNPL